MRSDHLAKHVKTHNGSGTPGSAKKGSSESCSDSEEPNTSDLHQSSPSNNNNNPTTHNNNSLTASALGMDVSGLHVQQHQHNNTMILSPHQLNAPLLHHHHHHHHQHHHASSPGLEHVNQLDIKPGIV